jgi:hypothetical protein
VLSLWARGSADRHGAPLTAPQPLFIDQREHWLAVGGRSTPFLLQHGSFFTHTPTAATAGPNPVILVAFPIVLAALAFAFIASMASSSSMAGRSA